MLSFKTLSVLALLTTISITSHAQEEKKNYAQEQKKKLNIAVGVAVGGAAGTVAGLALEEGGKTIYRNAVPGPVNKADIERISNKMKDGDRILVRLSDGSRSYLTETKFPGNRSLIKEKLSRSYHLGTSPVVSIQNLPRFRAAENFNFLAVMSSLSTGMATIYGVGNYLDSKFSDSAARLDVDRSTAQETEKRTPAAKETQKAKSQSKQ